MTDSLISVSKISEVCSVFRHRILIGLIFVLLLAGATFVRTERLEERLFHNDEGVNYHFIEELRRRGYFPYSHLNYHGPSYFYMTAAALELFEDDSETAMRSSAVVAGVLLVALLFFCRGILGIPLTVVTALFTIFSSSLVFYSRYAIHESLFLLCTAGVGLSLYCWHRSRKEHYLWLGWISLAVLVATKETFIISLFCLFWAFVSLGEWSAVTRDLYRQRKTFFWGALFACVIVIMLFTGGLRWPGGLREMFLAVPQWIGRNTSDTGHHKPFPYYLEIFRQSEPYLYALLLPAALQFRSILADFDLRLWLPIFFTLLMLTTNAEVHRRFIPTRERAQTFVVSWAVILCLFYLTLLVSTGVVGRDELGAFHRALLFFSVFFALRSLIPARHILDRLPWAGYFVLLTGCSLLFIVLALIANGAAVLGVATGIVLVLSYLSTLLLLNSPVLINWILSPQCAVLRFSVVWSVSSLFVYSFVKYKTPWLVINITFPALFCLSVILVGTCRRSRPQTVIAFLAGGCLLGVSILSSYRYNFVVTDTQKNKFYYVHSTPGMRELVKELDAIWELNPAARVLIGVPQYWPLPYYTRKHSKNVAYQNTSDFEANSKQYDVLIFPKSGKAPPAGWRKLDLRLSDVQESAIFFKLQSSDST